MEKIRLRTCLIIDIFKCGYQGQVLGGNAEHRFEWAIETNIVKALKTSFGAVYL